MRKRAVGGAGFVTVTLGALGCGDPRGGAEPRPELLFSSGAVRHDSARSESWRRFLRAPELHAAWVPPPKSPWRPYYKPTLVAAVSIVQSAAAPVRSDEGTRAEAEAARFAESRDLGGAAVFVDLRGEQSVAWAAVLRRKGFQPVLTFNNWPHQHGVLRLERPLGALLYYAEEMGREKPLDGAPPVFALEGARLAQKGLDPGPGLLDNRYFHAASDFPPGSLLRAQGITRVYYVTPLRPQAGSEEEDLNEYFAGLAGSGIQFLYVSPLAGESAAVEVNPVRRSTIFTAAETSSYSGSRPFGRSYSHYHRHFWSRSSGGWGSGGGGSGYSS